MQKFFVDEISGKFYTILGEDAVHISKSLRSKVGDIIILCDKNGIDYKCKIQSISKDSVDVNVIDSSLCKSEPNVLVTLYQAVPKSDKMDFIVKKCVELGIHEIVPVITKRCIPNFDNKSFEKKRLRLQKISLEAAKQSKRGKVPKVSDLLSLDDALKQIAYFDISLLFYEGGGDSIKNLISSTYSKIAIFIGPEGGFEEAEVKSIIDSGAKLSSLGPRILRTETASLAALSIIMFQTGNM